MKNLNLRNPLTLLLHICLKVKLCQIIIKGFKRFKLNESGNEIDKN